MIQVIYPNGTKKNLLQASLTLEEYQDLVGGYIDVLSVKNGYLIFDVDGVAKSKDYNETATQMLVDCYENYESFVSGVVVFTDSLIGF